MVKQDENAVAVPFLRKMSVIVELIFHASFIFASSFSSSFVSCIEARTGIHEGVSLSRLAVVFMWMER